MWDEEDGFFYDVLRLPDGSATRLKVRSVVGLLPLCATTVSKSTSGTQCRSCWQHIAERLDSAMPELAQRSIRPARDSAPAGAASLSLVNRDKLRRMLTHMLDENEFLSPYGIRSLSRYHADHPVRLHGRTARTTASATCRPSPTAACSAAIRTGEARSGCRSTR